MYGDFADWHARRHCNAFSHVALVVSARNLCKCGQPAALPKRAPRSRQQTTEVE
jgi:hypothetical protein